MMAALIRSAVRALLRRWLRMRIAALRIHYRQLVSATFQAAAAQGRESADALSFARRAMTTLQRARALERLL